MKKALSVLLSCLLMLTALTAMPFSAYALEESGSCGVGVTYTFDAETGALVISGNGSMRDYDKTSNKSPFYLCTGIKSVEIESGVRAIGANAFCYCANMTQITIPETVESIGEGAFSYCYYLDNVTVPKNVVDIFDSTFYYCVRLDTVTLPVGLASIGNSAFAGCDKLDNILYNGSLAQWDEISIHSTGNDALGGAYKWFGQGTCGAKINYAIDYYTGTLTISGSGSMDLFSYNESPFYGNKFIRHVVVEKGVGTVSNYLFSNCSNLVDVVLPDTVYAMGVDLFWYCTSLTTVNIPENIHMLGNGMFYHCNSLKSIDLNNVETVGGAAFSWCIGLTDVTFGDSVTKIGQKAFYQCESLTQMDIPDTVKTIGEQAFAYSDLLEKVTIGRGVTEIGDNVFHYCPKLTEISYRGSQDDWNAIDIGAENAALNTMRMRFSEGTCGAGVNYSLDESGVLTVSGTGIMNDYAAGKSPFYQNTDIKSVVIEYGVTRIGANAFEGCTGLTDVSFPDSVKYIDETAFVNTNDTFSVMSHCNNQAVKEAVVDGTQRYWYKEHTPWATPTVMPASLTEDGYVRYECAACDGTVSEDAIVRPESITLSKTAYTYDGKAKKPTVTVTDADGNEIAAGDYTVTYAKGRKAVGSYAVTVTFTGEYYTGSEKLTFKINPKGTSLKKVTAGKKAFTVKWKAQKKQTTGYQIQYSTNKNFKKGNKTVTVKKNKTVKNTVKKLKAKKKYYVRIRTYKKVGKTKYYSAWSKSKSVKTK